MHAVLVKTEIVADNIQTFWLKPEQPVDYVAGQFIEMILPHDGADDRGQKRWFTLSSSPTEELISITTKQATEHSSTFKQTLFGLEIGSQITISGPMGDFVLPKDPSLPLIFIAAGMGITPMRSMIKWLIDNKDIRSVQILYGARRLNEIAFRELLGDYGAKLDIVLSEEPKGWRGGTGRITTGLILQLARINDPAVLYVSGPELFVEQLEQELLAAGVDKHRLVLDFFPGYPAP